MFGDKSGLVPGRQETLPPAKNFLAQRVRFCMVGSER